jgi:hypothetical protein
MSAEEARRRAAAIRRSMDMSIRWLGRAFFAGDRKALGYASWADYLATEFGARLVGQPPNHPPSRAIWLCPYNCHMCVVRYWRWQAERAAHEAADPAGSEEEGGL